MINGYDSQDLLKFLDYLSDKGLGKPETMKSRKIAVSRIVETVGPDEFADIRSIDVDHIMERFQNLEGTKFTPDSLRTYKSRFATSVSDFLRYKENPQGFKISGQRQSRKRSEGGGAASKPKEKSSFVHVDANNGDQAGKFNNNTPQLELPIPIRNDCIIRVVGLPHDLKRTEAQKIANVILAMALVEE